MKEGNSWGLRNAIREMVVGGSNGVGAGSWLKEVPANPEKYTVRKIRGFNETSDPTSNPDLGCFAGWLRDEATIIHLRPPITPTKDLSNRAAINEEFVELNRYLHNGNRRDEEGNIISDDPRKMTPIFAVNGLSETIGMSIIRWKGNPLTKEDETPKKIASIEMVIVDPALQHKHLGVGIALMVATAEITFNGGYAPYDGEPAETLRLWYFRDVEKDVRNFYHQFGFLPVGGEEGNWADYCKARGLPPDGREGEWLELSRDRWEKFKKMDAEKEHPRFMLDPNIIDKTTLRSPIPVRARRGLRSSKG